MSFALFLCGSTPKFFQILGKVHFRGFCFVLFCFVWPRHTALRNLSSQTRDGNRAPCIGTADRQGSPQGWSSFQYGSRTEVPVLFCFVF